LPGEDFCCYFGVPLVAKGQVKGVLEVFHRASLKPDGEWYDFLNALAGQAAIAVENATLFESLQRSNRELALAYDATIEGWSHALDLRDQETEGHTQRVTEMTVNLARRFGFSEAELVQIRWGALLHDIGKMGVSDDILHKTSPLTDAEWVAMKKHPVFADEMLSPIRYLRLAQDIPYCHHEKWDGSGYPRGLQGAQIPLAVRIFTVVDVWDALKSDRPYRAAWTEKKVLQHIHSQAGTHFDPQVVDAFTRMIDEI
jgi:putative nucleotidyltransferase with HDIG domain